MKSKSIKMDGSILELKLTLESELVRNESMSVLYECENFDHEDYSRNDSESIYK
jgi:hypothetical protein